MLIYFCITFKTEFVGTSFRDWKSCSFLAWMYYFMYSARVLLPESELPDISIKSGYSKSPRGFPPSGSYIFWSIYNSLIVYAIGIYSTILTSFSASSLNLWIFKSSKMLFEIYSSFRYLLSFTWKFFFWWNNFISAYIIYPILLAFPIASRMLWIVSLEVGAPRINCTSPKMGNGLPVLLVDPNPILMVILIVSVSSSGLILVIYFLCLSVVNL